MPITEDIARTLYEHLIHIRRGLREKRTLEDTFRLVAPALAEIYQAPRTTPAKLSRSDSRDDSRYPSSSIIEMAQKVRRIDRGRIIGKAPPSAYCEIFGDYLPVAGVIEETEAIMSSSEESLQMVIRWWRSNAYTDVHASERDY